MIYIFKKIRRRKKNDANKLGELSRSKSVMVCLRTLSK